MFYSLFINPTFPMRAFSVICLVTLQAGVYANTSLLSVQAQNIPPITNSSPELPSPPLSTEVTPTGGKEEISRQFSRYILAPGDSVNVTVQRPPGPYILGIGDTISVTVQRFPDLSFQAVINPEGNIVVPLLGTVSLNSLTLQAAQEKVRSGLNRYVINPVVTLGLSAQRQDLNVQSVVDPDGNILVPQVGKIAVQGLNLDAAKEKVRLALSRLSPNQLVEVTLAGMRPVQVTITGEVFRPGVYNLNSAMPRIADILPLAGGVNTTADLRQVQIRRKLPDGTMISQTVDLYAALQNGSSPPNLRLQDGDAVIIPQREIGTDDGYDRSLIARSSLAVPQIKIRVLNYAAGGMAIQSLPNGSTFLDALGGVKLDTANLRDIALVRFDPERGKATTQKLDAKRALSGDASQNVALQDNDVIVVGRNLIGRVTNLLTTITQPFFNVQSFINFFQILNK
jgi:polysaccharide export outer membrane protein